VSHTGDFPQARSNSFVVIPARMASSRLPGKMLLCETGKPLIQHTFESAVRASRPAGVCVATDHPRIAAVVQGFGGDARLTDPQLASGTDRVAVVAAELEDFEIIVNVQGDEPEIAGQSIDRVIELLEDHPDAVMSTLATPFRCRRQFEDPNCVKVVFNRHGRAMYFSRAPIPRPRDADQGLSSGAAHRFFLHLGIYAYRRDFLLRLAELPPSELEWLEKLEQLRVLDAGHQITVGVVDEHAVGIDTPDDYRAFVLRHRAALSRGSGHLADDAA